jgi:hypothetical protein
MRSRRPDVRGPPQRGRKRPRKSNWPGRSINTTRVRSKTPEPPPKIRLGDFVRVITRICRLRGILHEGLDAFTAES